MAESTLSIVYKITWKGRLMGQQTINTFYYGADTPPDSLEALGNAQFAKCFTDLEQIVSNQWAIESIDIEGVKGSTQFASVPGATSGIVSGDCSPPFVSWDFTMQRAGVGERNAYKRIAGVPESMVTLGVITSSARTLADIAAPRFAEALTVDAPNDWLPLIKRTSIHKVHQTVPKYYTMSTGLYSQVGSQNSRKFGHGR